MLMYLFSFDKASEVHSASDKTDTQGLLSFEFLGLNRLAQVKVNTVIIILGKIKRAAIIYTT